MTSVRQCDRMAEGVFSVVGNSRNWGRLVRFLAVMSVLTIVRGSQLTNRLYQLERQPEDYLSEGKVLTGHLILDDGHKSVGNQCALECLRHHQCRSFNFDRDSGLCQLNNATHKEFPADFVDEENSEYHVREAYSVDREALGPCASNPCKGRGQCLNEKNSAGRLVAVCICHEGWAGSSCQHQANVLDWGDWGGWTECSVSCHRGWRMRNRKCTNFVTGQAVSSSECYGADVEYNACILLDCPKWKEWGEWGSCSASRTCGLGTKVRNRACANGGNPGVDRYCLGATNESAPCLGIDCRGAMRLRGGQAPGEGRLEVYNDVSEQWGLVCSDQLTGTMAALACKQMGFPGAYAVVTDGRFGVSNDGSLALKNIRCQGGEKALLQCSHNEWSPNSTCNSRKNIAAGLQCNVNGVWSLWSEWSECSVTCENGTRHRTRMCNHPSQMHNGKPCEGETVQYKPCQLAMCPIDGVWTQWSDWSLCSLSCATGSQDRTRTCRGPFYGGADCSGENWQRQDCKLRECPIDAVWENWATWSACSLSCGNGSRSRARTCTGPFHGGKDCEGDYVDWLTCNTFHCPVDGVWLDWSDWSPCSVTCSDGYQQRNRTCKGPFHGGADCSGPKAEAQNCHPRMCPVDGVWLPWEQWSECSRTCGRGERVRTRTCEGPFYHGAACEGNGSEFEYCNPNPCPVDGVWSDWSDWSPCNTTCGGGMRERLRKCDEPRHGGAPCVGLSAEYLTCAENPCTIPGDWLPWTPWSQCSVTCGGGERWRTRVCNMTTHGDMTSSCLGDGEERVDCHTFSCTPYAHTCSEWMQRGLTVTTVGDIDPDGEKGLLKPVQVLCDLDEEPGQALTVIGHDSEGRIQVQGYEGALEYQHVLNYNVSLDHVISIVDQSTSCRQYIRWECKAALIHNLNDVKPTVTGWLNRTEQLADYFGGAQPGSGMCACGMDRSCVSADMACNCDANDDFWRFDDGDLTYKDDLPITVFVAGDTGGQNEDGYRTVGRVKCFGAVN